jgi:alpha-galactosidase
MKADTAIPANPANDKHKLPSAMYSIKKLLVLLSSVTVLGSGFAAESKVAQLPPMGWNSWNTFAKEINEPLFIETAEALISSGLAEAGYVYVNVDDGWSGNDANAALTNRFPKGIGHLADQMHQRKLKLGLYTNWRSIGKEARDAKQWAEWEIDLIKNDAWKTPSTDPYWMTMRNAIAATGWPIVHSVHFSDEDSNPTNICEMANLWRITNDIQDYYDHASIPEDKKSWAFSTLDIVDRMAEVAHLIKPGCWADADMLEIGNGKQTADEYKTQFTMWCLLPAPLLMGHDVRKMTEETKAILMNKEAIAVNQDPAVIPARRIRKTDEAELWSRKLADGSLCVVLLQKTKSPQEVGFGWEEVGLKANQPAKIRDLWAHAALGSFTNKFSIKVNAHGCAMLKVTPQ